MIWQILLDFVAGEWSDISQNLVRDFKSQIIEQDFISIADFKYYILLIISSSSNDETSIDISIVYHQKSTEFQNSSKISWKVYWQDQTP